MDIEFKDMVPRLRQALETIATVLSAPISTTAELLMFHEMLNYIEHDERVRDMWRLQYLDQVSMNTAIRLELDSLMKLDGGHWKRQAADLLASNNDYKQKLEDLRAEIATLKAKPLLRFLSPRA